MEATAVSLARSVLEGVVSSAGSAIADEVASLLGVPREVEFIRNELEMMQSFLLVSSTCPDAAARNDTVRTWVKQVRDLAYDVEDCLFDFSLYSATTSRWSSCLPGDLAERHAIAARIRDLKVSVEELNRRNQRYHVVIDDPSRGAGETDVHQQQLLPYHDVLSAAELAFQEWEIIGRSSDKEKLIEMLMPSGDGKLGVVSVWGMGGMGKSSLVSMVRNDPELLDAYDCGLVWVTVPHPLDSPDEFVRRLRKQLGLGTAADHGDDHDDIKKHLENKRYMIVVDDLLTKEEWDQVWRTKLFNSDNTKGSRVIVTTRRKDVAEYCAGSIGNIGHGQVYELKPLGREESRTLLCNKVYKLTTLPVEMEEQASLILKRCRGLPLAISTIGGLLANRPKTRLEWIKLHEHLGAELESDLRDIGKVIASSYDGLPYHLKSIFLYLSIFPENHEIRSTRLLRRWMAEGYIAKRIDMPVEEVGERFYNDLINRSMIQPSKKTISGLRVDHCRIHSMVLQIISSKAVEENQLFLIEKQCMEVPKSKIRHLVISRWEKNKKLKNINLSYIRSLAVFGDCPVSLISPKMRLLRVLDLEDTTNVKNEDLRHIGDLPHLRYLSLRGTKISKLPSSLQNLRCLETLDIQGTQVTRLPHRIVKLEKLRYLLAGVKFSRDLLQQVVQQETDNKKNNLLGNMVSFLCCNYSHYQKVSNMYQLSVRAPKGIDKLTNLHVLGAFNVGQGNGLARRLEQLTDLQRLAVTVTGLTEEGSQELCQSIGKLGRLQKLEVRSRSLEFLAKMDDLATPKHLASLKLLGELSSLPTWITLLNDLTKLRLLGTNLKQAQVNILGGLRSVAFLGLWEKSYDGESLSFSTDSFPKLKFLDIDGLKKNETVAIQKGAMSELEKLWVNNCIAISDSRDGLSGVPDLENLDELLVKNCGKKEKLIEELQLQVIQHSRRPKFLIGKIVPTSSKPSTSTAAEHE